MAAPAYWKFESIFLQQTVRLFPDFALVPGKARVFRQCGTGHRRVTAGDTVLIQGSGGVSVFALRFAQVLGARVIPDDLDCGEAEGLKALGAAEVINYTETPGWDTKVRELTDGRGGDCVIEIGGLGTIAMSLKALAVGGHVPSCPPATGPGG